MIGRNLVQSFGAFSTLIYFIGEVDFLRMQQVNKFLYQLGIGRV